MKTLAQKIRNRLVRAIVEEKLTREQRKHIWKAWTKGTGVGGSSSGRLLGMDTEEELPEIQRLRRSARRRTASYRQKQNAYRKASRIAKKRRKLLADAAKTLRNDWRMFLLWATLPESGGEDDGTLVPELRDLPHDGAQQIELRRNGTRWSSDLENTASSHDAYTQGWIDGRDDPDARCPYPKRRKNLRRAWRAGRDEALSSDT